jgi:hypothetical protein
LLLGREIILIRWKKSRGRVDYPELNYSALLNFCREILIYENYILSIIEKLPHYDKNKELAYLREQVTATSIFSRCRTFCVYLQKEQSFQAYGKKKIRQ